MNENANDNVAEGIRGEDIIVEGYYFKTYYLPNGDLIIPVEDVETFFKLKTLTAAMVLEFKKAIEERNNAR